MLQLVLLARHISSRLNTLETHLRSTLAQTIPRLQALAAAGVPPLGLPPPTAAAAGHQQQQQQGAAGVPAAAAAAAAELLPLRLAAFPNKLQPLGKLQAAAASSRFMSLPSATVAGADAHVLYRRDKIAQRTQQPSTSYGMFVAYRLPATVAGAHRGHVHICDLCCTPWHHNGCVAIAAARQLIRLVNGRL
jgi:hypothetical protein